MATFDYPLKSAVAMMQSGDMRCTDYVGAFIDRALSNLHLNAFLHLDFDVLREEAELADQRRARGEPLGALHGIPLAVKDCIDIANLPTTAATPALHGNIAPETAPIVQTLFDAGALLFAKTNMYELAFGITSGNEHTGAVLNPHDPTRSAGGSSSGSAAAVAAGLCPAAIGTDTAGSVRIPAAHCGVFGYRPTHGRYTSKGILPLFPTRDVPGLMARSAEDLLYLDSVLTGDTQVPPCLASNLRLGIPRDYFFDALETGVASAVARELERLSALGAVLIEIDLPDLRECLSRTSGPIRAWELPRSIAAYLRDCGGHATFETLIESIAADYVREEFADALKGANSPDLEQHYRETIEQVLPEYRNQYRACLQDNALDAFIFPAVPVLPTKLGQEKEVIVDGTPVSVWRTMRNALPASFYGAPGISVPIARTPGALPAGLEFDGMPGMDRKLLSIAAACSAC